MSIQEILIISTIIGGTFFIVLGTFGIFRLPDFFCRGHALTKSFTLGISLLLTSSWLYLGDHDIGFKALVAIIFLFSSIPLSGHVMGLVALRKNTPRWRADKIDHFKQTK